MTPKEYRKTLKELGIILRRKNNSTVINKTMSEVLKIAKCPTCNGQFKQSRSGSYKAICLDCGIKVKFKYKKR